jgi:tape measure domain-containing protein
VAYRADIEIAVKGAQELKRLQDQVSATSKLVDGLNNYLENIGSGGVVRSIQNLRTIVSQVAAAFDAVAINTEEAGIAARNYYEANKQLNNGLRERLKLLNDIQNAERGTVLANIKASQATRAASGFGAFSSGIDIPTQKSIRRNAQKNAVAQAATETAIQIQKLNDRQAEFTTRTDAAAQAAARQTAAFYKQARVAKEVAKINAAAPAAQLLLAPAAPGAPAMGGGARRRVTGAVERLGGARTGDQAATALRFAQGLKEQVRPLSQIQALYAGIAGEALKLQGIKALPDTQMLNAAARGLQTIESIEGRRLQTAQRRRQKLQQIQNYYGDIGIGNAGAGFQGPAVPPGGIRRRTQAGTRSNAGFGRAASGALSNAAIGGAFPLLFGQSRAAAAGGALGGIAGSLLGPSGGFAGSLVGTILGEKLGQGNQVKQLGEDIGFSAEQTKMLGVAFQQAGRDFDKFQQSVSTIQGLSLSIEDQAKAIQLASSLTETYKGKIDKVTNAFAGALSTGKVTQGTLNQLTNNGIPIQQALADKYNVSRSAIIQMAKDGKISVQDLIDTLVKVGNEGAKAAGTQKDVFADSFEKISKAVADFQTTASKAFKETGDALRVDLGGAVQAVTTYITDLIGGFGELARVAGPVLDPIISGYINLEKAIFNAVGAVPALKDAIISFVLTTLGPLQGVVTLMNQIRGLGAATKGPEKMGPYVPDRLKQKPLQSFIAPSQAAPSGGSSGADKAAKAAEREAERVANIVRDRAAEMEIMRMQMIFAERIAVAEIDKDPILKAQLQTIEKINQISINYSKAINDERAKGNSILAKEAITKKAVAEIDKVNFEGALETARIEIARKENYNNLLMDLDQELKLRSATTEEARNQLRIEYEMAKLKQGGEFTGSQLTAIQDRKQALATPKTDAQLTADRLGQLKDELNELTRLSTVVITAADSIGNAFGTSFKGIIDGTMTAREALAGFFQSVADAFLDMAAQIISKWIQMTILNSVLSIFPGGGLAKAGGAGFNMGAINNTGLSTFNSTNSFANLGMKAAGGPVAGGTPYIVGEKGPELFVPGRGGTIVPNHAMGGGTTNVVVNVDASGNSSVQGDQQQAKQLGVAVSAAVQAELVKQQRPGGLLAGTRR